MTTCIAGTCELEASPRIVLCTDTRIVDTAGAHDFNLKSGPLGSGWHALMAHDVAGTTWLRRKLREKIEIITEPISADRILGIADEAGAEFLDSPASRNDQVCELLLAGFYRNVPILAWLQVTYKANVNTQLAGAYWAIGSGAAVARAILANREYSPFISPDLAKYYIYEAKVISEKAQDVGAGTSMSILAPDKPIQHWSDEEQRLLPLVYGHYGLRTLPDNFSLAMVDSE